jgi:hypothetical protein
MPKKKVASEVTPFTLKSGIKKTVRTARMNETMVVHNKLICVLIGVCFSLLDSAASQQPLRRTALIERQVECHFKAV